MDSALIGVIVALLVISILAVTLFMLKTGFTISKVMVIAVSVIVLAVTVPFMIGDDSGNATSVFDLDSMYYDDYIECDPSLTIDSGPLEVLTINGSSYVHADGIGEATISLGDKHHTITVDKAQLDVFMIAGQSNAEHSIYNRVDADPKGVMGTTYYYGTSGAVIKYSAGYDTDNYSIFDMVGHGDYPIAANVDLPFASTYYAGTGHKVLVVNTGIAGTAVLSWTPGNSSYLYAKTIFNDALGKINTDYYIPTVKSYIWIQGEGDTGTSVASYTTRFLAMHNSFIGNDPDNEFSTAHFDGCLISKVRAVNGVNSSKAQLSIVKSNDTVHMATTISDTFTMGNALMLGDNLHYSQLGDNLIGTAVARYILN